MAQHSCRLYLLSQFRNVKARLTCKMPTVVNVVFSVYMCQPLFGAVMQIDSIEGSEAETRAELERIEDLAALTAFGEFQLDLGVATPPEEISMDSVTGQLRLSDPPDVECHVCDGTKPQKSVQITEMKAP